MANRMDQSALSDMLDRAQALGFRPERLRILDKRLSEWSMAGKTPALVARVLRHGQLAFEGAYGPLTPDSAADSLRVDSLFPICSMTKPVISALACIMQEEGLLDLNAPACELYPEFTADPEGSIRLWHFLCHTSGLTGDEFERYATQHLLLEFPKDEAPEDAWRAFYESAAERMNLAPREGADLRHAVYRAITLAAKPTHAPQTIMRYNSLGYDIIKDILIRISGMSIDDYAREKLFAPLGMHDSHFLFPEEKMGRYVRRPDNFTGADWLNGSVLQSTSGGGGLKSSAIDMTKFGQMFLGGGKYGDVRILSRASVRLITSDHNPGLPLAYHNGGIFDPAWGLGFNVGSKKDDAGMLRSPSAFEHGGFGCVKLLCDPEADVVAAFFMVSIEDNYPYSAQFNNIVLGALDD